MQFTHNELVESFEFLFSINKTYRNSGTHPITLLKQQRQIEGDHLDVIIIADGKRLRGYIYKGTAGYGLYYQLRIKNHEFSKLPIEFVNADKINLEVVFEVDLACPPKVAPLWL